MKKLGILICMMTVALLMVSCDDWKTPPSPVVIDGSEYYVKYSISSSFYNFGSISYADVHGTVKERTGNYANTSNHWSVTIGPVNKGFHAFVKYESGFADEVTLEVSKNNSPFALKASGKKEATYTIDY